LGIKKDGADLVCVMPGQHKNILKNLSQESMRGDICFHAVFG
jgi:hypothetical protein